MNPGPRIIFFVSDSTGITVEKLGNSLLSQFPGIAFERSFLRYVDSGEKAVRARERIEAAARQAGMPPIVFSTLADPALRAALNTPAAVVLDVFESFMAPLAAALGESPRHVHGHTHGLVEGEGYLARMEAVNYALSHDDGLGGEGGYARADVILLGVSRSGKTPVCLYLAMQYGLFAANYPLVEEDLQGTELPAVLRPFRDRLFALSIDPRRLQQIRARRRPGSEYADPARCRRETSRAEALFAAQALPVLDTTAISVEEIATRIIAAMPALASKAGSP